MTKRKIYFVHEGKENYPEIAAYKRFFASSFEVEEIHPDLLEARADLSQSVCWMIMGFYPRRPAARVVIHDYRSLSVGKGRALKDRIKRFVNAVPDIRIFQNEEMARHMGFTDKVPSLFLPMGVPEFVTRYRRLPSAQTSCDFCYIGVMSQERRTELMFDSFLKRFGKRKSFHAFGTPEESIVERYRNFPQIVFMGRQPQETVFAHLAQARVAVNYFPVHLPHALQTPTKLLEYAALGLRILNNEQPQSRAVSERYGIQGLWGPTEDLFAPVPEMLDWADNAAFDPRPLLWPEVIEKSGISPMLVQKMGA